MKSSNFGDIVKNISCIDLVKNISSDLGITQPPKNIDNEYSLKESTDAMKELDDLINELDEHTKDEGVELDLIANPAKLKKHISSFSEHSDSSWSFESEDVDGGSQY